LEKERDAKLLPAGAHGAAVLQMKMLDDVIRRFGGFGDRFLTTSADDTAKVWETSTLKKLFEFEQSEPIDMITLPPSDRDKSDLKQTVEYLLFGTIPKAVSGIIAKFI